MPLSIFSKIEGRIGTAKPGWRPAPDDWRPTAGTRQKDTMRPPYRPAPHEREAWRRVKLSAISPMMNTPMLTHSA